MKAATADAKAKEAKAEEDARYLYRAEKKNGVLTYGREEE